MPPKSKSEKAESIVEPKVIPEEVSVMTQTKKLKMVDKNTSMHNEVLPFFKSYVSHVNSPSNFALSSKLKDVRSSSS